MEEGQEATSGQDQEHAADAVHHPTDALSMFEHNFKPYVDVGLFFFGFSNAGVPFGAIGLETWITVMAIFFGKTIGIFVFTLAGRAARLTLPAGMTLKEAFVMGNVAAIGFTVALFVTDVAFPKTDLGHGGGHATAAETAEHASGPGDGHGAGAAEDPAADPADSHAVEAATHGELADAHGRPAPPRKEQTFDELTPGQQGVVKDKVKMGALLSFFAGLTSLMLGRALGVRRINTNADLRRAIRETSG